MNQVLKFELEIEELQNILEVMKDFLPTNQSQFSKGFSGSYRSSLQQSQISNFNEHRAKGKLIINKKFVIKRVLRIFEDKSNIRYRAYQGIDLDQKKYVIIYLKPLQKKVISKKFSEDAREKICPPVKWAGIEEFDNNLFDVEVHEKFGPTLKEIVQNYNQKISDKTFYMLTYHMLKLAERINIAGYTIRTLTPKIIVLSESYLKNDLFLLNIFDLEGKQSDSKLVPEMKYCSIGSHLKLKLCTKDMIESICYILIDFYKHGQLFEDLVSKKSKDYIEVKTLYQPRGIPYHFTEFYYHVKQLNQKEQFKFSEWKLFFKKLLSSFDFDTPYQWIKVISEDKDNSQSDSSNELQFHAGSEKFQIRRNKKPPQLTKDEVELSSQQLEQCQTSDNETESVGFKVTGFAMNAVKRLVDKY